MAANELVRQGVVICDYLIKECQYILGKRKKTTVVGEAVDYET
jgi:hypothetical protein